MSGSQLSERLAEDSSYRMVERMVGRKPEGIRVFVAVLVAFEQLDDQMMLHCLVEVCIRSQASGFLKTPV